MLANPIALDERGSALSRVAREKRTLSVANVADDPDLNQGISGRGGPRALLLVPLMNDGHVIGAIVLRQSHLKPFTAQQIEAVETFADQAVIAISNVNLFEQVQERTRDLTESLRQQTATADVLKVISASPGELEPVFHAMLENAVHLCEAKFAMLFLYEAEKNQFRSAARWNLPPAYSEFLGKNTLRADPMIPLGKVVATKRPVQIEDVLADQSYIERYPGMVGVGELGGARTLLQVPLLKENELVGTFGIYRQEVRPFTDKQIELVQNFAAQAVIAIENARLLNELRQRTDDLTNSLNELRTAQDRLVQTEKLASLGQLTAGIAHEIKNPLNFVNNFSALSAELTDELNDLLRSTALNDKLRGEVDELTGMLKDNLQKVVQHGKRADSIVKNMLLHSREGSGEHRPADINAILDESLNLAYHGARAEKREFNVTLQRDFDEMAGTIEVFPQEITRVFLNLISNGFYAVTKRKSENGGSDFEPVVRATTRSLGDAVEVRIRDNGTGIPAEVKEKMFNPFFTTKPAGEGTGLGLSMSHDIIVKQHGGRIDVETEPGEFTEFRIVLPRTKNLSDKNRGQT
jgi:signal transduction histidine kinase